LTLTAAAFSLPHGPEIPTAIEARQAGNPHWYKYWANDQAVVESDDLNGGEFTVEWNEPNGGNFVIGKGYQTGFNTWAHLPLGGSRCLTDRNGLSIDISVASSITPVLLRLAATRTHTSPSTAGPTAQLYVLV
jgi:hypothetical protein